MLNGRSSERICWRRNGRFGFLSPPREGQEVPLNADVLQQVHEFGIQQLRVPLEVARVVSLFRRGGASQIVEEIAGSSSMSMTGSQMSFQEDPLESNSMIRMNSF